MCITHILIDTKRAICTLPPSNAFSVGLRQIVMRDLSDEERDALSSRPPLKTTVGGTGQNPFNHHQIVGVWREPDDDNWFVVVVTQSGAFLKPVPKLTDREFDLLKTFNEALERK